MGQAGSRRSDLRRALRENDAAVTAVELDGTRLTEKDMRKLAEALKQNRSRIRGVDLDSRSTCTRCIYVYACVCSVVQKLSMDKCDVTPTSVQQVASVLCNSALTCSIRKLSLAGNDAVSLLHNTDVCYAIVMLSSADVD